MKKTLVLGASEKVDRYANRAVRMLTEHNVDVVAYGNREGRIDEIAIVTTFPEDQSFHTVTLYLSERNQAPFFDKIIRLNPKRVIFNPGTENPNFESELIKNNIPFEHACTLVMLSTGVY